MKVPIRRDKTPLIPMMETRKFAKWGVNFRGPIHLATMKGHEEYIIVAIGYVTKWVEAKATINNDAHIIAKFLYKNIFTCYRLPFEIVSDRRMQFLNNNNEYLLG